MSFALEPVSTFQKNSHVEYRFGFAKHGRRRFARIWQRVFLKDDTGAPGINVPLRHLDDFINHLIGVRDAAVEKGYSNKETEHDT